MWMKLQRETQLHKLVSTMAKRVYQPHPALDVTFSLIFLALAIVYSWVSQFNSSLSRYYIYIEGRFFWTLVASTAIVTAIVWLVEKSLRSFGIWFSHRYLSDEKHRGWLNCCFTSRGPPFKGVCPQEVRRSGAFSKLCLRVGMATGLSHYFLYLGVHRPKTLQLVRGRTVPVPQ